MSRTCSQCERSLNAYNLGKLCGACQVKARDEIASKKSSPHYNVEEMRCIFGLKCQESVRRWARKGAIPGRIPLRKQHLFTKDVVDQWLKSETLPPIGKNMTSKGRRLSYQLVLIRDSEAPAICPISRVSRTNEVQTVLGGQPLYITRAVALVNNEEIPVVYDWDKGYWRMEKG